MNKVTILCDNNTIIDQYFLGEPALSFLVECDGKKVLFDFGYSDVYLKNAEALNIDLNEIDCAVLSHGHNDHTGGLRYWNMKKVPLICHPDCMGMTVEKTVEIGNPLTEEEVRYKFELNMTKEPVWITENCCFLGEIPTTYDFEKRTPIGRKMRNGCWEDDLIKEDSALAIKTDRGLWIVTGCSHAGICSIIAYAQKITGISSVAGVMGGFHLLKEDEKLAKTIKTLAAFDIDRLIPTHCVSLKSKIRMAKALTIEEAGSGVEVLL